VIESLIAEPMESIPAQRKETIFVSALPGNRLQRIVKWDIRKGVEHSHIALGRQPDWPNSPEWARHDA